MLKHIVLFQIKDFPDREKVLQEIKQDLEGLVNSVPSLLSMEVGINDNPDEVYHLSLISTMEDMKGLQAYAIHPEHRNVAERIKAIAEARSAVDYYC